MQLVDLAERLAHRLDSLHWDAPVAYTYNPLTYARVPHAAYLERFARRPVEIMLLGMNPGPFGMVQTGVPFGAVPWVRDWMGIEGVVQAPAHVHPKRPIEGFACRRVEVSGDRLWRWAQAMAGPAENFFARFFVHNYCPLAFLEASGRNLTPDKLPLPQRRALFALCDAMLRDTVRELRPRYVIGIGAFAEKRARAALEGIDEQVSFGQILHPSPASPLANRGWAARATADLKKAGVALASA